MSDRNEIETGRGSRASDPRPQPEGHRDEMPMSATEARQGRRGAPVIAVLAGGLLLAMLAWGAVEWWAQTTEPPAEQTATPPAGDTAPGNPNAQPSSTP